MTNIWGTATGAPNAPVASQVLVNGVWKTSQRSTTDSKGFYAIPLTYGATTPGTYTYRAVVTVNGRSYTSPNVTLTRTAPLRLDPRCYTSGVVVCASKSDRKVYYVNKGKIIKTHDARFGGLAYDTNGRLKNYNTREGTFTIFRKVRDEISYSYNNTPMPFTSYFYGGQAFHYSYGFAQNGWVGDSGSHGCINLRDWNGAEWLYNNMPNGTLVVVYK
ncbi:MAG TPA: L,D-transpeptidase family protein [Intrasporangiaceae bacterium]|nr:L,D-transpeptidase family protein [Intrasporangiaceae bacterium]